MLKIGIHRAKYYHSQWYYYIIPKRLTLKCNPPIYKWLCFVIGYERGKRDVKNKRRFRFEGT